jgi:uncharacterized lipoprotein YddW (UPF0748 family)
MHRLPLRPAAFVLCIASAALLLLGGCYRRADLYGTAPAITTAPPADEGRDTGGDAGPEAVVALTGVPAYVETQMHVSLPVVQREFRGVWVATVGNMDWPSRRSLSSRQAQDELIRLLDTARDLGLNAVIFQVRPMADAFYESALEPWSDYLTGASGRAPEPFWDPLAFAIEHAHARGLELHAWFNPFRAGFIAKQTPLAAQHISKRRPDLIRRYGTYYWLDPGEPDARRLALDVVTDVVRRYDVDAVHIDDYFYPYQERDARGRLIAFPDEASWREHGERTGLSRNDWRRSNIDTFVEQLYRAVRAEKQHVRVGISPFGIWRPGYPATVRGLDSYNELYADTRKWLLNGWADYYAPQLYWRTSAPQQPYVDLLQWWSEQNPFGRHIWAGNIPNNINSTARGWDAGEIVEQVRLTRAHHGATGNVHFSASSLRRNPGRPARNLPHQPLHHPRPHSCPPATGCAPRQPARRTRRSYPPLAGSSMPCPIPASTPPRSLCAPAAPPARPGSCRPAGTMMTGRPRCCPEGLATPTSTGDEAALPNSSPSGSWTAPASRASRCCSDSRRLAERRPDFDRI